MHNRDHFEHAITKYESRTHSNAALASLPADKGGPVMQYEHWYLREVAVNEHVEKAKVGAEADIDPESFHNIVDAMRDAADTNPVPSANKRQKRSAKQTPGHLR